MLEIKIKVKNVNYSEVVDKALPIMLEKLSQKEGAGFLTQMLSNMKGLSAKAAKAALSVLPQDVKDEMAIYLLSSYKEDLVKYINQMALEKNVEIEIDNISIEKCNS